MTGLNRCIRPTLVLSLALIAAGCAPFAQLTRTDDAAAQPSAAVLYDESMALIKAERYQAAATRLGELLTAAPQGDHRPRAMLALAYSQLRLGQPAGTEQLATRVIRENAESSPLDYALYLRASALLAAQPAPTLEQVRQATEDLENLGRRYPDSRYTASTRGMLASIRERLAANELQAARQQLQDSEYVAALNRCRYLIEHYPDSDAVPAALELMVTAYRQLGLHPLAESTEAVLQSRSPRPRHATPE